MKVVDRTEFWKAHDETDGFSQIENSMVCQLKVVGDVRRRLVYEDAEYKPWIIYYTLSYVHGIIGTEFIAHEAESYEVCVTKYREKKK